MAILQDASDRVLRGHDGQPLSAQTGDASVASVVAPPWSEGEDGIEITESLQDLLDASAVLYVRAHGAGTTTLTLSRAGLTRQLPVSVSD